MEAERNLQMPALKIGAEVTSQGTEKPSEDENSKRPIFLQVSRGSTSLPTPRFGPSTADFRLWTLEL